ncbi:MAG: serine/threonine protein kinase [Kiritimatiellaeota bacterium]|nr:serine/threonine protein kinase [Kiritimatiellota bacterium]
MNASSQQHGAPHTPADAVQTEGRVRADAGAPGPAFRCPACRRVYALEIEVGRKLLCSCGNRFRLRPQDLVDAASPGGTRALDPAATLRHSKTDLRPGDLVGPCRIERSLGAGSSGSVFLARHHVLEVPVALKVLAPTVAARDPEYRERFLREARTAAELRHPNVVRVLDWGEENGRLYLAMEYVEGGTVADLLGERGHLTVPEALTVARDVARALVAAGSRGIVHRDVNPKNIIRSAAGPFKLADLGLARHVERTRNGKPVTREARGLGTPYYMPPEQIRDARAVDARADIYALGATLYHMLTGLPPYVGKNAIEVLRGHLKEAIPSVREHCSGASEELEAVVRHCLAKDPARRYQSAGELLHDIELLLRKESCGRSALFAGRRERSKAARLRRAKLEWGLALVLLLLVLLPFAWWTPVAFRRVGRENVQAESKSRRATLAREAQDLLRQLAEGRAGLVSQARIWARLAAVQTLLGNSDQAFQALNEFVRVLGFLPESRRRPSLGLLNTDVFTYLMTNADPAQRTRERLDRLRESARGVFPAYRLRIPDLLLRNLGRELRLHATVEPAGDYWADVTYAFRRSEESADFYVQNPLNAPETPDRPSSPALQAATGPAPARRSETAQQQGQSRTRRMMWRCEPGPTFAFTADIELGTNDGTNAKIVLGARDAWLYVPLQAPAVLAFTRDQGQIRCEFRTRSGEPEVQSFQSVQTPERLTVRVVAAFPQMTVRVNGATLFSGVLPGRPSGEAGRFGVVLFGNSALRRLTISMPVEELVFNRNRPQLFFYPLLHRGEDRPDAASTLAFGVTADLDPMRPPALLPPEIHRKLQAPDKVCARYRADPGQTPAFLAWFPVGRESAGCATELEVCTVDCPKGAAAGTESGVLELYDLHTMKWVRFRNAGTEFIGDAALEQRATFFRIDLPSNRNYLTIQDEYIVRWRGAKSEPSETALDFMLLIDRRRP